MNQELARTHLLSHARSDKNGIFPLEVSLEGKLTNPVCGDHVELKIHLVDETIKDIGHKANACAICSASASILCEEIRGKDVKTVLSLGKIFEQGLMEVKSHPWPQEINNLQCFEHIRVTPSRKMCALLPWVVLRVALKGKES